MDCDIILDGLRPSSDFSKYDDVWLLIAKESVSVEKLRHALKSMIGQKVVHSDGSKAY
jgi:hypothetical protein